MLSGQNIVCFAPNTWDDIWRNRHQIMSRLARQNRILFVEPHVYLRQIAPALRKGGPFTLNRTRVYSPIDNLWVYQWPTYAPISGKSPLRDLTFSLRQRSLRRVLQRLDMTDPILWVFQYNLGEMIGHLDEKLVIYHAVDEYSAYAPQTTTAAGADWQDTIRKLEKEVIGRADLVFVTSSGLYERKRHLHQHVFHVPNGVDYDLFSRPTNPLPSELIGLSRPVIGYAGVINEKIDYPLLEAIASKRPDWQFIFVGPIALKHEREQLTRLQALPNVHFLGRKPVEELPNYLHPCDVCLIPYKNNEWTRNISPLKLYEYLATGAPIVSTDIPAAREFPDTVRIASDQDAFIQAIIDAMQSDTPERRREQQQLAQAHSWDKRVETLSNIVEAHLKTEV